MKQRTRPMHSGDDELMGFAMVNKKNDDENEIQLHKIRPQDHYIEAQVQEEDTLQAIALRFYCSISELKRINHIHKDNEIYARRTIKVPVTPYSVLTELMPSTQAAEPAPSTCNDVRKNPLHETLLQNNYQNNNTEAKDFSIDCNELVMNSTLSPAVVPYTDVEVNEPITEDTQLLPNKEKVPVETVVVKHLTSQGADYGIKWYHLVVILLVLGMVVPLFYVIFKLDKHEHSDLPPLHST